MCRIEPKRRTQATEPKNEHKQIQTKVIMENNSIKVDLVGEGSDSVVFVHGLGGSSSVWWPQVELLRKQFRLVLPELPGSGRTPAGGKLSISGFVDTIIEVLDAQKIESAAFVGHSMGTLILQHLAVRYPERVKRLALVAPVKAAAEAHRAATRDRASRVRKEGMGWLADQLTVSALSAHTRETSPVAVAFVREILLRQEPEGYARTCDAVAEGTNAAVENIRCPTLIIAGENDGAKGAAEALAKEIPNARFALIAQAGHWLTIEQPQQVSALLAEFLTE
jgi:3-oxoadipate enol-lactonase